MVTIKKARIVLVLLWGVVTLGWASDVLPAELPPDALSPSKEELVAYDLLAREGPANAPAVLLGIVVAFDQGQGSLVLGHGDGTHSTLVTDPGHLQNIQIGDPVKVAAEGSRVRTLEPLDLFSLGA